MTPGIRPLSHFTPFRAIKVTPSFVLRARNLRLVAKRVRFPRKCRDIAPISFTPVNRAFSKLARPKAAASGRQSSQGADLEISFTTAAKRPVREKPPATIDEVLLNGAALKVPRRQKFSSAS